MAMAIDEKLYSYIYYYDWLEDQLEAVQTINLPNGYRFAFDTKLIAEAVRGQAGIDNYTPISDLAKFIEDTGVRLISYWLGKDEPWAEMTTTGNRPTIIINRAHSIERQMFGTVREMWRIMEKDPGIETHYEHDANEFALNLLLPVEAVIKDFTDYAGMHWVEAVDKIRVKHKVSRATVLKQIAVMWSDRTEQEIFNRYISDYNRMLYKEMPALWLNSWPVDYVSEEDEHELTRRDFTPTRYLNLSRIAYETGIISYEHILAAMDNDEYKAKELIRSWTMDK